jgi:hypothetical protein
MIEHKLIFNDNNFEAWDDVNKKNCSSIKIHKKETTHESSIHLSN